MHMNTNQDIHVFAQMYDFLLYEILGRDLKNEIKTKSCETSRAMIFINVRLM